MGSVVMTMRANTSSGIIVLMNGRVEKINSSLFVMWGRFGRSMPWLVPYILSCGSRSSELLTNIHGKRQVSRDFGNACLHSNAMLLVHMPYLHFPVIPLFIILFPSLPLTILSSYHPAYFPCTLSAAFSMYCLCTNQPSTSSHTYLSRISTAYASDIHRGRCNTASTYFTKLSSSLFFALMGGEVGASAFLPPVARTAPPMVTVRVAIASCETL